METHHKKMHTIVQSFEKKSLKKRPIIVRIADFLTNFFGSFIFLFLNIFFFVVWILLNSGIVKDFPIFDPYPFILLTMSVSLEAINL